MGYQYGIERCRDTLCILSSNQDFEEKLSKSFSEINIITVKDVSKKHFKELDIQFKNYLFYHELSVSKKGKLVINERIVHLEKCANELVYLCVEIIEHNSRNCKNISSAK